MAEALPQGESDARALAVWLAGVHDIGKATPAFACQVDQLADAMCDQGPETRSARVMGSASRRRPSTRRPRSRPPTHRSRDCNVAPGGVFRIRSRRDRPDRRLPRLCHRPRDGQLPVREVGRRDRQRQG
ncbi:HD domain-containing protein [Streptomyces sp. INA 01156]